MVSDGKEPKRVLKKEEKTEEVKKKCKKTEVKGTLMWPGGLAGLLGALLCAVHANAGEYHARVHE